MFKKPFKVKTNSQIKGSERKGIKDLFLRKFPQLTENDMETLLPKKEVTSCLKVLADNNKHVTIYTAQKRALFFMVDDIMFPTVYMLWMFPQIGVEFTTNDYVMSKISNGADLMLPGVINTPQSKGNFLCKQVAIVNNINNKAAVAVGLTAMSSVEMSKVNSGKCVNIFHYYGDKLCTFDDLPLLPLMQLSPPDYVQNADDFPALTSIAEVLPTQDIPLENPEENCDVVELILPQLSEVEEMDILLIRCIMTALKYSKTLELPMLTSTFFKLEVLTNCPEAKTLDIKKSSYKKVGQVLKQLENDGIIVVKEKKKGVENIEAINKQHPAFLNLYIEIENRPRKITNEDDTISQARNIVESYMITTAVLPIFKEYGFNKGDNMQVPQIRRYVTEYVRSRNCQDEQNKRFVKLQDPVLKSLCKNEVAVTWEDLMEKVRAAMKSCFKVSSTEQEVTTKGKIQPIAMTLQARAHNKKVTMVDNLELYNIRLPEFAKECQHGVAASTSINRPAGKKYGQILIQGNQILFVYNLLVEKYKIPKKYIRGLELAPKNKK